MIEKLGYWFVHGLFGSMCMALGCLVGMIVGAVISLILATVIGWEDIKNIYKESFCTSGLNMTTSPYW